MSGLGPFDMAAVALSIGAEPILAINVGVASSTAVTSRHGSNVSNAAAAAAPAPAAGSGNSATSAADLADLVEYCHGSATATKWGQQRAADGMVSPLNVTYFELGNEMYNFDFRDQVVAMEARANAVGMAGKLHYIYPLNAGPNSTDAAALNTLGLATRLIVDTHHWFGTGT